MLAHEAALGPGRDDDRVLHLLGLGQPQDLGAEVLPPVRPAQPATGHGREPQVHGLQPRRVDERLEPRPWVGQFRHGGGIQLEHQVRRVADGV